jgi:hypothetical protein
MVDILTKYGADVNVVAFDKDTPKAAQYKRPRGIYSERMRGKKTIPGGWHSLSSWIYYSLNLGFMSHPSYSTVLGVMQVMQHFYDRGWDTNLPTGEDKSTMVHKAVSSRNHELLKWLLQHGAAPDIPNKYFDTAAKDAYYMKDGEMLRLLFRYGSRFSIPKAEAIQREYATERSRKPLPENYRQNPDYIARRSNLEQAIAFLQYLKLQNKRRNVNPSIVSSFSVTTKNR